jgi:hypothetical protein
MGGMMGCVYSLPFPVERFLIGALFDANLRFFAVEC